MYSRFSPRETGINIFVEKQRDPTQTHTYGTLLLLLQLLPLLSLYDGKTPPGCSIVHLQRLQQQKLREGANFFSGASDRNSLELLFRDGNGSRGLKLT